MRWATIYRTVALQENATRINVKLLESADCAMETDESFDQSSQHSFIHAHQIHVQVYISDRCTEKADETIKKKKKKKIILANLYRR